MLYPLKFKKVFIEKVWGGREFETKLGMTLPKDKKIGESWEISAHPNGMSVIENGFLAGKTLQEVYNEYKGKLVGEKVYSEYKDRFPLLIKYLDVNDRLSIQVHPNDEIAMKNHNELGKSESWYIMEASDDAVLIMGMKPGITKDDFLKKAVELIILEGKKENIFERDFTPRIKRYFDSLEESLYGIGWYFHAPFKIYKTEEGKRKDEKYRSVYNFKDDEKGAFQKAFYECFNKRKNLLDILDTIKKVTKIDFESYFHEDILNTWKVIKAIETAHKDTCVIDFIINFDEKKYIELCEKFSYNIEKEEVTKIANELKERLNR